MTITTAQTTCPRCNAAVAAGAQFCGSCGASLAGAPIPPVSPPIAPTPPPMPQMVRAPSGSGGPTQQATFAGTQQDAFAQAMRALQSNNAEVTWQQPPHGAKFLLTRKSFWSTAGIALKYDGDLTVQPAAPGQTTARFALKLQWNSAIPLLAMQVLAVIVAAMFNVYFASFALILILVTLAVTAWNASSGIPEKALQDIIKTLQTGGVPAAGPAYAPQQPVTAAPVQHAAQSAPAAQSVTPAPPAAPQTGMPSDTTTIVEQIKQLAGLRDAGAITVEEFEAKKAELLKRI